MKSLTLLHTEHDEQSVGSTFDPVLSGVAQGLARLFPPIENVHAIDRDDDPSDAGASDGDADGSHTRR